jgi:hypothetical protein
MQASDTMIRCHLMKRGIIFGIIFIEVITLLLIYFIFFSPTTSPIISMDSDGDGHPNSSDVSPHDSNNWTYLSATLYITVVNSNAISPISYEIKVDKFNWTPFGENTIEAGSTTNMTGMFTFQAGVVKGTTVTIIASSFIDGAKLNTDTWTGFVGNNEIKNVTMTI